MSLLTLLDQLFRTANRITELDKALNDPVQGDSLKIGIVGS